MTDLIWLTDKQIRRIEPHFLLSHGAPSVDNRRVEHSLTNFRSARDLSRRILREEGIVLLSDEFFGVYENCFRVGFGCRDFKEMLERFDSFLERALLGSSCCICWR